MLSVRYIRGFFKVKYAMACIISFRAIDKFQRERLHQSRATVFTWNGQMGEEFLQAKS